MNINIKLQGFQYFSKQKYEELNKKIIEQINQTGISKPNINITQLIHNTEDQLI